jgi:hypothetical protein
LPLLEPDFPDELVFFPVALAAGVVFFLLPELPECVVEVAGDCV